MLGLALAASRLVDEKYPDLPQRWLERDAHMGPAAFLLDNYPDLVPQLVASLSQEQRNEARQALLEILQQREDWAKRQPAVRLGEEFEAMISQFPGLPQRWSERSSSAANSCTRSSPTCGRWFKTVYAADIPTWCPSDQPAPALSQSARAGQRGLSRVAGPYLNDGRGRHWFVYNVRRPIAVD